MAAIGTSWAVIRAAALFVLAAAVLAVSPASASAGIVVDINKSAQRMTVTVDGVKKYTWPVSTGARGYTTPSGSFQPFRMEEDHFSEEWDDAPMPHSIFFTQKGHAIHGSLATRNLGRPVSHGCVRLSPANATTLYNLIEKRGIYSTRIYVHDGSGRVATVAAQQSSTKKKKKLNPLWKLYE